MKTAIQVVSELMGQSDEYVLAYADFLVTIGRYKNREQVIIALLNKCSTPEYQNAKAQAN